MDLHPCLHLVASLLVSTRGKSFLSAWSIDKAASTKRWEAERERGRSAAAPRLRFSLDPSQCCTYTAIDNSPGQASVCIHLVACRESPRRNVVQLSMEWEADPATAAAAGAGASGVESITASLSEEALRYDVFVALGSDLYGMRISRERWPGGGFRREILFPPACE